MDAFNSFVDEVATVHQDSNLSEVEKSRRVLWLMARFLYFQTSDVPTGYVSEFHVWWEQNAKEIIGITIDEASCMDVAEVLERHFSQTTTGAYPPPDGLPREIIANCRFFSAAQDFGGRFRRNPFDFALERPEFFEPPHILKNPSEVDEFLRFIGAEAQYDKRRDYARNGAKWLIDNYNGQAINLYEQNAHSVKNLSKVMNVKTLGMGFSAKKTHMFVRDMFDWGVWSPGDDVQALDVASDANTMRLSLRTGILRLQIPTLIPSYLDIHSPQYTLMDQMNVAAWRRVWELWGEIPDNHRVLAPAFFDFFIYMLGRTTCRKTTPKCLAAKVCSKLGKDDCPSFGSDICQGFCPFNGICEDDNKILQPPKSISILGRTGWDAGSTNEGGGLGITA